MYTDKKPAAFKTALIGTADELGRKSLIFRKVTQGRTLRKVSKPGMGRMASWEFVCVSERNKLTRPLGFREKALHEQELKKKSCKNDKMNHNLKNTKHCL
jgi:hypothetical protein